VTRKKEPLVSIIMPLFNAEKYLQISINSVINQIYKNWEMIIVDDNSTDESLKIAKENSMLEKRLVVLHQGENKGAAEARNLGIKFSKGEYIAFLDSDDVWNVDKLVKQIEFMKINKYLFSCTYYGKIDSAGNKLKAVVHSPQKMNYNKLLTNCPGNSTVIYNAQILGKTYIPPIRKRNDYLMWLGVIKKANYLWTLQEVNSYHRLRKDSISSQKMKLIKYHWKIYRSYEKLSFLKSAVILTIILVKGINTKIKKVIGE
jgi:glycosyltransferase involved in cell wall biosynthesis